MSIANNRKDICFKALGIMLLIFLAFYSLNNIILNGNGAILLWFTLSLSAFLFAFFLF